MYKCPFLINSGKNAKKGDDQQPMHSINVRICSDDYFIITKVFQAVLDVGAACTS
jgi:hypothetical protein